MVTSLDRSNPLPLWAQLERDLKARLDGGEFVDRFPTDGQLVEEYEVSRHTVREAIRHLNKSGILRRERGRGTVVNTSEFVQPLGALYSLFESIEASGVEQRSEVIELKIETDPVIAERLGLGPDTPLMYLERMRFAADEPLAIDSAWLPMSVAAPLLDADYSHTALYDELERRCGFRPDEGSERITPVMPSTADRARLQMRRGEAAFFIERRSLSAGRPIEWRTTTIRGSRYTFMSNWAAGNAPAISAAVD